MGRQGGGDSDFSPSGGEALFCSRRGEGYRKIAYKILQNRHFLQKFRIFLKICNFAFLRQIFGDFHLYREKNFF